MPVYPRFRGRHKLHRFEDTGLEKCVGCSLCAAACPADCIRVVAAENTPENRVSAGERYAAVYEINLIALHLLRLLRGRLPVRRDHDGPRLRAVGLQPRRPHLHQGDAARRAARAHAAAARRASRTGRAMSQVFFFIAAIGAIAGAIGVVVLRNPFYTRARARLPPALAGARCSCCCEAQFVAAAQVIVYAGAVMVLYVFVVAYVGGAGRAARRARRAALRGRGAAVRGRAVRRAVHRDPRLRPEGARLARRTALGRLRHAGADRPAAADEVPARVRARLAPAAGRGRRRGHPGAAPARPRGRRGRGRAPRDPDACAPAGTGTMAEGAGRPAAQPAPAAQRSREAASGRPPHAEAGRWTDEHHLVPRRLGADLLHRRRRRAHAPQPARDPALPRADAQRRQPRADRLLAHARQRRRPDLRAHRDGRRRLRGRRSASA